MVSTFEQADSIISCTMLGVFAVKKEIRAETSSVCHGVDSADLDGLWRG
jgi:hypothetical protein